MRAYDQLPNELRGLSKGGSWPRFAAAPLVGKACCHYSLRDSAGGTQDPETMPRELLAGRMPHACPPRPMITAPVRA
jgi:hypothetical protein